MIVSPKRVLAIIVVSDSWPTGAAETLMVATETSIFARKEYAR
jgi:hypothetical protein